MDNLAVDYYAYEGNEDMRFCLVTDSPCGTDTEAMGKKPCQCENCQDFRLEAYLVADLYKDKEKPVLHLRKADGFKVCKS